MRNVALLGGSLLLVLAGFIHSWYSANATVHPSNRVSVFRPWGFPALLLCVALLVVGLAIVWLASSVGWALVAAGAYFFILPLVTAPLLDAANLIPGFNEREAGREWREHEERFQR
jgi:hypothetical protein